jgi:hypothetical protein
MEKLERDLRISANLSVVLVKAAKGSAAKLELESGLLKCG